MSVRENQSNQFRILAYIAVLMGSCLFLARCRAKEMAQPLEPHTAEDLSSAPSTYSGSQAPSTPAVGNVLYPSGIICHCIHIHKLTLYTSFSSLSTYISFKFAIHPTGDFRGSLATALSTPVYFLLPIEFLHIFIMTESYMYAFNF